MSKGYSEESIEDATQDVLEELGWEVFNAFEESFDSNGILGRDNKSQVILSKFLIPALKKLNPGLPEKAYQDAVDIIAQKESGKSIGQINKEKYELLKNGVQVSFTNSKGERQKKRLKVFDFNSPKENHFIAVRQLRVIGELSENRPDVVGFVNGIPLVFMELKRQDKGLFNAYTENLRDYKDEIPHLFHHNAFVILSNGIEAKVGTITSSFKYFLDWKRIEEGEEGVVALDTMLRGTCDPARLMDIFENFLLFDNTHGEVAKLMAKNHQYIGVNKVLENVKNIEELKGKLGVFWHTQGSGKSYSMVFLCEKIHRKLGGSYTFLIAVDRTELENQIYDTFSGVGVVNDKNLIAGKKSGISGRDHLRELLAGNHRYVFTLIHKFSIDPEKESDYPLITDRKNIIVISDEAHRTQGGTFAQNMRFNGLPNASFIGFTGTPIIKDDEELTKNIFGDYVSVYDFKRAIEDKATLPLRYINKGEKLELDNPELDEKMAEVFENEDLDDNQKKKLEYLFTKNYPVLTSEKRLDAIAKDLVWHFNDRGYQGKAMFVAIDKPTAVRMHALVMKYLPLYKDELQRKIKNAQDDQERLQLQKKFELVDKTEVCVVVSGEQNEVDKFRKLGLDIEHHRKNMIERNLEKEFKDPDNDFRLAIVCAMWITGFDAQCVSTVYLDKPIKGHTLMQTIARANRVYDDEKENGLIVDYGNVYKQLEQAYSIYGEGSKGSGGTKTGERPVEKLEELAAELEGAITKVNDHLQELNFSLDKIITANGMERLAMIEEGKNAISLNQKTRTKFEVLTRAFFRKFKALYPEKQVFPFVDQNRALDALYGALNQSVKGADITSFIKELQGVVNENITLKDEGNKSAEKLIDLTDLDFEKLRVAFAKAPKKNTLTYNMQQAIEKKLDRMIQENPLRIEFLDRYQEIIKEYNEGKDFEGTLKIAQELIDFIEELTEEEKRIVVENIENQEVLAIYDLLKQGKNLDAKELKAVKKVAAKTLANLKDVLEKEHWREKVKLTSEVKSRIRTNLFHLPQESYPDSEIEYRKDKIYQHVYSSYFGGGNSVYKQSA